MPSMAKTARLSAADPGSHEAVRCRLAARIARWTEGAEQVETALPGLTLYRHNAPTDAVRCMVEPAIALPVQGTKRAVLGNGVYAYDHRRYLLTTLDLPVALQAVKAHASAPYLSLVLRLDERCISDLVLKGVAPSPAKARPATAGIGLGATSAALLDAFDRLVQLLDDPAALAVLAPLVHTEIHYRLLTGELGGMLWQFASAGSQGHRVARAIAWLKMHFEQPLRVDALADLVQMSPSRFHHHFKQLTAWSPLQFQKYLRLQEARRLMLTDGLDAAAAAFRVGYESPSQFGREYRRQFGFPPRRDVERLRLPMHASSALAAARPIRPA